MRIFLKIGFLISALLKREYKIFYRIITRPIFSLFLTKNIFIILWIEQKLFFKCNFILRQINTGFCLFFDVLVRNGLSFLEWISYKKAKEAQPLFVSGAWDLSDRTASTDYHSCETPVIWLEDLIEINIYFKSLSTDWDGKL